MTPTSSVMGSSSSPLAILNGAEWGGGGERSCHRREADLTDPTWNHSNIEWATMIKVTTPTDMPSAHTQANKKDKLSQSSGGAVASSLCQEFCQVHSTDLTLMWYSRLHLQAQQSIVRRHQDIIVFPLMNKYNPLEIQPTHAWDSPYSRQAFPLRLQWVSWCHQ